MGGRRDGKNVDEVKAYNLQRNTWSSLPSLPEAIAGSAAAMLGEGQLYSIGGMGGSFSVFLLNSDSTSSKWKTVEMKGAGFQG